MDLFENVRPPRGLITPAVDIRSGWLDRWRRVLTWALGLLWLLDAALQYQPYMFTRAFPQQMIRPAGQGSPAWVRGPVDWAAELLAAHIVAWNAVFATIQLAIALGLFLRRTRRAALLVSIAWSLGVWWLGEGLGGVLAGPVSALDGLPGAVVIYALIALLLLPRPRTRAGGSVAEGSVLARGGARLAWLVLWASFVFETLRPANRVAGALSDSIAGNAEGEPAWIRSIDRWGASATNHHGSTISIALAILFALIAAAVLLPAGARRVLLALTIALMLLVWVVGQDFGAIATGRGTDPNSALPLALLALCYWPARHPSKTHTTDRPPRPLPRS